MVSFVEITVEGDHITVAQQGLQCIKALDACDCCCKQQDIKWIQLKHGQNSINQASKQDGKQDELLVESRCQPYLLICLYHLPNEDHKMRYRNQMPWPSMQQLQQEGNGKATQQQQQYTNIRTQTGLLLYKNIKGPMLNIFIYIYQCLSFPGQRCRASFL